MSFNSLEQKSSGGFCHVWVGPFDISMTSPHLPKNDIEPSPRFFGKCPKTALSCALVSGQTGRLILPVRTKPENVSDVFDNIVNRLMTRFPSSHALIPEPAAVFMLLKSD